MSAGEVLHYSFGVTNSGSAPLPGPVTVADDKSTDEFCPAVNTVGDLDDHRKQRRHRNCLLCRYPGDSQ